MEWHYAEGGQQRGPVDETEFQNLVRSGKIGPETLVWREGMSNWQPYAQVTAPAASAAPAGAAGGAAAGGMVCSQCFRAFPPDQVIRYGDAWVCAACKPAFLQRLKEGMAVGGAMEYAGFWIRLAAKIVDGIILWIINMGIGFVIGMVAAGSGAMRGGGNSDPAAAMLIVQVVAGLGGLLFSLLYGVFFLGRYGATPGKMVCKIKVVTPEGEPISYGRAAGRCLAEILSGIICYIGYLMAAFDDERRSLHDRICNTRVIKQ